MRINLEDKTLQIIKTLTSSADSSGVKVYFVGGLVRDAILGREINDIDLLIEGNAIDFVKSLDYAKIKSVHEDFGTIKASFEELDIDFASTRKETYPHSGCLPVVSDIGVSVEEDLRRRDFSVNAIAAQITNEGYRIVDIFQGQNDIEKGTLRVLHNKSIIDDPTRILRGLDFKLRFNFDFDPSTKELISQYLKSPDREYLSTDRVYLTFRKLFSCPSRAKEAFKIFSDEKYYKILYNNKDLKSEIIDEALNIFKPKNISDVYYNYIIKNEPQVPHLCSALEIYKFFEHFSLEELCVYFAKTQDKNALKYFSDYKDIKLTLTGSELINMGYKEGRRIGEILDCTLECKLKEPNLDEIKYVRDNFIL